MQQKKCQDSAAAQHTAFIWDNIYSGMTSVHPKWNLFLYANTHTAHPRGAYGKVIISQIMKCNKFLRCNCNEKDSLKANHRRQCQNVWEHIWDLGPWSAAAAESRAELSSVDGILPYFLPLGEHHYKQKT